MLLLTVLDTGIISGKVNASFFKWFPDPDSRVISWQLSWCRRIASTLSPYTSLIRLLRRSLPVRWETIVFLKQHYTSALDMKRMQITGIMMIVYSTSSLLWTWYDDISPWDSDSESTALLNVWMFEPPSREQSGSGLDLRESSWWHRWSWLQNRQRLPEAAAAYWQLLSRAWV